MSATNGYGFKVHHRGEHSRVGDPVDCGARNSQAAAKDWEHVDCQKCLAKRPVAA